MTRTTRTFTCCLLAFSLASQPMFVELHAQVPATKKDSSLKRSDEQRNREIDSLKRELRAVEEAQRELPRETFDLEAIVGKVGKDPHTLLAWVRDNTSWVPYRGALRGSTGVLMDRLGNSLDRSLLLADLLRTAGHDARLAQSSLSEQQATELFARRQAVPRQKSSLSPAVSRETAIELVTRYATKHELDVDSIRQRVERDWADYEAMSATLTDRVTDQSVRLAKAVGSPSINNETGTAQKVNEAMRDHWWVQIKQQDAWQNFDASGFVTAECGAGGEPQQTVRWDDKSGTWPLDAKICHEINIRVVIEQWKEGVVREQVVLSHTLRPLDLFYDRIAIRHQPMKWPKTFDLTADEHRTERLVKTATDQDEWLPVLVVGSRVITDRGFSATGDTWKESGLPLAGSLEKGVQGLDPFKRLSGLGGKRTAPSATHLTAEWIEYEIRAPGRNANANGRIIRRELFDLLGPSARRTVKHKELSLDENQRTARALTMLGETEILPTVCRLSNDFVEQISTSRVLENGKTVAELMKYDDWITNKQTQPLLSQLTPLPGELHALALVRWENSGSGNSFYLDQPNLFTFHRHVSLQKGGDLSAMYAFDIVANDVAVHLDVAGDAFAAKVAQGIRDTNAEALLLKKGHNVADLFSVATDVEWLTIRGPDDSAWKQLNLPDDMRERINQDLTAGFAVVVPKTMRSHAGIPVMGWWRIDPVTGQTLGIGDRGWGQNSKEWTMHEVVAAGLVIAAISYLAYAHGDDIRDWVRTRINTALGHGVGGLTGGHR